MFGKKTKEITVDGEKVVVKSLSAVDAIEFREFLKKDSKQAMFFLVHKCVFAPGETNTPCFSTTGEAGECDVNAFEKLIEEVTLINGIDLHKEEITTDPTKG